ncbi:hypothetical protein Dimus_032328 [Dionaea muscipula]
MFKSFFYVVFLLFILFLQNFIQIFNSCLLQVNDSEKVQTKSKGKITSMTKENIDPAVCLFSLMCIIDFFTLFLSRCISSLNFR